MASSSPPNPPIRLPRLLWLIPFWAVTIVGVGVLACGGPIAWTYLINRHRWELSRAASDGDMATVRRLVTAGVDMDTAPQDWESHEYGLPALTTAALAGHENVVRYLLDHGAKVNRKGISNPLIAACWRRHFAVAKLLLEHGADPNIKGEGTPLYAAEGTDQKELADLLRQYGARQ